MPTISRFYGIVIRMYFSDHAPPHFHAVYSGEEAVIAIESGDGHPWRIARASVAPGARMAADPSRRTGGKLGTSPGA
jgi:hypothetical protein